MADLTYTPKELIATLGLSRAKIYQLLKENRLPHIRIDNKILIPKKALDDFLSIDASPGQVRSGFTGGGLS